MKQVNNKENIYASIAIMALSGHTNAECRLEPSTIKELESKGFKVFHGNRTGESILYSCKVYWDNPSIKDSLAVDMLKTAIQKLIENYESMSS